MSIVWAGIVGALITGKAIVIIRYCAAEWTARQEGN